MELEIKKLDINGNGIAYHNKKVVFVKGALAGEKVEAHVVTEHLNYSDAEIDGIIKKSRDRVQPRCKIYRECGGCNIMHLSYSKQLEYKRNIVSDSFRKYLGYSPRVNMTIGMSDPYNYRNKAQLHLKKDKTFMMGLYKVNSNHVVDIMGCDVQDKYLNVFLRKLKDLILSSHVDVSKKGLNRVMVRTNGEEYQVVLVTGRKIKYGNLINDIEKIGDVSVFESITRSRNFFDEPEKLIGKSRLLKTVGDKQFYVRPKDFYQLNDIQTKKLYDLVKLQVKDAKRIVDCYSGVGTISQYIAFNQEIRGIELLDSAVESARDNAMVNKVEATYRKGRVGSVFKRWVKEGYRPDLIIFDPPRVGLDEESFVSIQKVKPNNIIYVSCNPATLAKDIKQLDKLYEITYVQPIDMFPQTSKVECVVKLERKRTRRS